MTQDQIYLPLPPVHLVAAVVVHLELGHLVAQKDPVIVIGIGIGIGITRAGGSEFSAYLTHSHFICTDSKFGAYKSTSEAESCRSSLIHSTPDLRIYFKNVLRVKDKNRPLRT